MTPSLSQSILQRADAYVSGRASLDTFKDWLVGATWNVEQDEPGAAGLTYEIKLLLAEQSSGDLAETDLRMALRRVVAGVVSVAS